VFIGTLYPLFLEAVAPETRVSVGPPFYNVTFVPLMLPLVVVMAAGPLFAWKRADLAGVLGRLKLALAASIAVALGVWYLHSDGPLLAVFAFAIAAWLFVGTLSEWAERVKLFRVPLADSWRRAVNLPRSAYGTTLAHAGLAIAIAGMVGSTGWKQEIIAVVEPGGSLALAGYDFRFEGIEEGLGPNYSFTRGTLEVSRDGAPVALLKPEKRLYPTEGRPTTEAAIHTTGLADLYAVIGEPDGTGGWALRIYLEPLVPWIWAGSLVMMLGGFVSLTDRRLRVGAPRRKRPAPTPTAVPAE
jgi:cytochrome c-type biogenesis protein CcmF